MKLNILKKFMQDYLLKIKDASYILGTKLYELGALLIYVYTKYCWLFSLQHKSAEAVIKCLVQGYCAKQNINFIHGRPRNPKEQGIVERIKQ